MAAPIYHMCRRDEWEVAEKAGAYHGSSQDIADGFIHFSSADQVKESAAKHRAGQDGLVLIAADPDRLGTDLKWERARHGQLFPHLHGALSPDAVISVRDLPLGSDGLHAFPDL
ncbi:MAG: DUF952 domain-containing protein [Rhodospirillales bacterium]|nr:DUF952 domain-containing protein [Rhodospirillales bacterium]MDP6643478.1 DUF952 domain-containing protein [Rhodospirillales bacterium]MDP6842874.1 DUF952 domain-containing protein [Rhodospirillales bacterium]